MEKRRVEEIGVDAVEAAKQVFQNHNGSGSILGVFFGHGLKGFSGRVWRVRPQCGSQVLDCLGVLLARIPSSSSFWRLRDGIGSIHSSHQRQQIL